MIGGVHRSIPAAMRRASNEVPMPVMMASEQRCEQTQGSIGSPRQPQSTPLQQRIGSKSGTGRPQHSQEAIGRWAGGVTSCTT